jgi:outer membrane protein assembly factor BamB
VIDGFGNIYFNVYAENKLYCLNQSGQLKWTKQNMNSYTTPVITNKNRIVVSSGAYIISYDTSGTEQWRTQAFSDLASPEAVLLDDADNVYYLGSPFGIRAASVSPAGIKRWETISFNITSILSPPALLPQGKLIFTPKRASAIQAIN